MANHLKNFKKNKKSKYGQRKQKNSHSYQRYRDSTSPGSVTSPTGNHASSSFQPVLHVHGSDHRFARETTVSREPPAPRFLVEVHALWQAYSSVRESNPLSGRVALYRAGRLHAKYVLHVPDPPLHYCFALEEVRFLETLQTIENQQQSGRPISNEKRQQLLQIWECDLLPIKENENDNPTQIFNSKELSSTNISRANENGPAVSNNIRKHDRALKNHKIKLRDVETKLIQVLSANQKAVDLHTQKSEGRQERSYSWIAPTNQKGCDSSGTTVGKSSTRRIQICPVYFCLGIIWKAILNNFQKNA